MVEANQDRAQLVESPRRLSRHVDHTYRDFSHVSAAELPRKKSAANFPSKLHQILSTEEFRHIISWMPHGRGWKIHDKELLVKEVVPRYFSQNKYESFTRQLNGWGFKRLHQSGRDFNVYYCECFLRDLPHLTVLMKRVPRNQGKLIPHVEGEPNFYEIDQRFPLPRPSLVPYQAWESGSGYGVPPGPPRAPPGPPVEYHRPEHYAPHPTTYPPPQYYACPPDPIGPPLGYPSYPFYTAQYGQPHRYYQHHPYPAGPQGGSPRHFVGHLSSDGANLVQSRGTSWSATVQGEGQEDRAPVLWEGEEGSLEPLSVSEEAENTTTNGEHDSVKESTDTRKREAR